MNAAVAEWLGWPKCRVCRDRFDPTDNEQSRFEDLCAPCEYEGEPADAPSPLDSPWARVVADADRSITLARAVRLPDILGRAE